MRLTATIALAVTAAFAMADGDKVSDGVLWNEGVDAYRDGDAAKALSILRPLMSSETHGARAAEVVAKLEYDAAHDLAKSNTLEHLERAAAAAQQALRSAPEDRRANDNFTRATDGLKELRETTRVNRLIEDAQGKDPSQALRTAMDDARRILERAKKPLKAGAAEKISAADADEAKLKEIADVWIPIKDIVSKNVTNAEESAAFAAKLEEARAATLAAAKRLGDLDPHASDSVAMTEDALNGCYKIFAMPPETLGECLVSQSNSWAGAERVTLRPWNEDALGYAKSFRAKFDQWAEQYRQQAQANTNMVPLSAEACEKIRKLAERLEAEQTEAIRDPSREKDAKALGTIREIISLMPVPPPQQNQQQQQQDQQQQDQQQKQQQQRQKDNQQQQSKDDRQDRQQQDQQQDRQEQKKDEAAKESEEKTPEEKEAEAILRRIQEKSDEHEDAKRRAMGERRATRDW